MGSLQISQLSKAYKKYPTRWARLAEWLDPRGFSRHTLHWVLKDIDLKIAAGEAVGIIGTNGAGKSTLLKLITGTTQPTSGHVETRGRVAALLELGMGFHPDFTGRQNAIMAGQLLGHDAHEMTQLMGAIAEFAEIDDYIDQPVRFYSSGMQMRLAFSVATVTRPDILIVDEALSVGDAYFQYKSFDRIRAFRKEGTTLLIVSHDRQAIQSVCDRAVLLDHGQVAIASDPETVMDYYNAMLAERETQHVAQTPLEDGRIQTVSGSGEAEIVSVRLVNDQGEPISSVAVGQVTRLQVQAKAHSALDDLVVGYVIKDRLGQNIFGTNTGYLKLDIGPLTHGQDITIVFRFPAHLGPGHYSVAIALHSGHDHLEKNYEWRDRAFIFEVSYPKAPDFVGLSWMPVHAEIL